MVDNDSNTKKVAKGIKKSVIKKELVHELYKKVLLESKELHHKMNCIRSKNHEIYTYEINKKSLSCFDDKRYILDNGIESLAYGHTEINTNEI